MESLQSKVEAYVKDFMSAFDASHDYAHVERVHGLAKRIEAGERQKNPNTKYNSDLITLAALLHDVTDRKYITSYDPNLIRDTLLIPFGADHELAENIQTIVNHVSYTSEVKDPEKTRQVLGKFPELGIVQDADRLDAIGAVGIGRVFAYGSGRINRPFINTLKHFEIKLEKLEAMMKTETGKEMARVRTERLNMFKRWWAEEEADASLAI